MPGHQTPPLLHVAFKITAFSTDVASVALLAAQPHRVGSSLSGLLVLLVSFLHVPTVSVTSSKKKEGNVVGRTIVRASTYYSVGVLRPRKKLSIFKTQTPPSRVDFRQVLPTICSPSPLHRHAGRSTLSAQIAQQICALWAPLQHINFSPARLRPHRRCRRRRLHRPRRPPRPADPGLHQALR